MSSRIDPSVPAAGRPVSKADLRHNFEAIRDELGHLGWLRQPFPGAVERTGEAKLKETLSARDFGAVGDGRADDTAALQAALDALKTKGGVLALAPGAVYRIAIGLRLEDAAGFRIEGRDACLMMTEGAPVAADYWLLKLVRCHRFEIAGLRLDGNRRTRAIGPEPWANNLHLHDCSDFVLQSVLSSNAVVDGFILYHDRRDDPATFCRRGLMLGCRSENAARQGLTILNGHDIRVLACDFTGSNGVPPEAGIDIESHVDSAAPSNARVLIQGCHFEGNRGGGIRLTAFGGAHGFSVVDCSFRNCGLYGVDIVAPDCIVRGCRFSDFGPELEHGVVLVRTREGGLPALVDGNSFDRILTGDANKAAIYVRPDASPGTLVADNRLNAVDASGVIAAAPGTIIRGNLIDGNRLDGIRIGRAGLVESNRIARMRPGRPAILVHGGDTVVRANHLIDCDNGPEGTILVLDDGTGDGRPPVLDGNFLSLTGGDGQSVPVRLRAAAIEAGTTAFGYG